MSGTEKPLYLAVKENNIAVVKALLLLNPKMTKKAFSMLCHDSNAFLLARNRAQ
jgi:hypothetical protein